PCPCLFSSSRRRHTRSKRDWSSDVCSSDLVREAEFKESRLNSADESSGIYHALYALLMARGARDWRSAKVFDKTSFFELSTGFHQIFPDTWCAKFQVDPALASSVLNHTPMGKRTEVVIDGQSPDRKSVV